MAKSGFAIASLIIAITSLLLFWIPVIGLLFALAAVILAIFGIIRTSGGVEGMAIAGLIIGIIALLGAALSTAIGVGTYLFLEETVFQPAREFNHTKATSQPCYIQENFTCISHEVTADSVSVTVASNYPDTVSIQSFGAVDDYNECEKDYDPPLELRPGESIRLTVEGCSLKPLRMLGVALWYNLTGEIFPKSAFGFINRP